MDALLSALGAATIGTWFNMVLCTMEFLQTIHYFRRFKHDPIWLKGAVGVVCSIDITVTILLCQYIYQNTVTNFGEPAKILQPTFVQPFAAFCTGITSGIATSYLLLRYWRVSKNSIVSLFIGALIVIYEVMLCIAAGMNHTASTASRTLLFTRLYFTSQAVVDVALAAALIAHLLKYIRSEFKRTETLIRRIVYVALETGCITTVFALLIFLCTFFPTQLVGLGGFLTPCFGRLYGITFLGNLNLRGEGGMLSSSHGNKPGTTATFKLTTVRNPISQVGPTETVIEGIQIHQDVDVKIEKDVEAEASATDHYRYNIRFKGNDSDRESSENATSK